MDAFELARQKHAKNLERRLRTAPHQPIEDVGVVEPEVMEVPKEKPVHEAIIEVKVTLPDGEFSFALSKPNIYANATKSRLTRSEIKRCVENGLSPLFGRLNELPRRG